MSPRQRKLFNEHANKMASLVRQVDTMQREVARLTIRMHEVETKIHPEDVELRKALLPPFG